MKANGLPGKILLSFVVIVISACHDPYYDDTRYDSGYIASGEYHYFYYNFTPYETYRLELITYSGDADIAVFDNHGDLVVFSQENATNSDEVIFTAGNGDYEIEIYGNYRSDYELIIERIPYNDTGLSSSIDGLQFDVSADVFTGELFKPLASKSFQVSNAYDILTITPDPDPIWLDVTPTGLLYSSDYDHNVTINVNILETESPAANNFATVILRAEDFEGKVNIFREVDIVYHVSG